MEETFSEDSNFDIELALSLPRSDGPLPPSDPPSPFEESDDDLGPFERITSQFVLWSNSVDQAIQSFGQHWNARQGWKPKQSFKLTRYESQFYLYSLRGEAILASTRSLLQTLTPGGTEWEETLDMIEYIAAFNTFMISIRNAWKATAANKDDT